MKKTFAWMAAASLTAGLPLSGAEKIGPDTPDAFAQKVNALRQAYDRPPVDTKQKLNKGNLQYQLEQADKICDGFVFFYNSEPIEVGLKEIDWFGKQRNHQEWVAQLNRFFMLERLITAYQQTGDEKYPERARALMDDWFHFWKKHNYRFVDPQNNNVLNCSLRIRSWIQALAAFRNTRAFDDAFVARLLENLTRQANMLAERTKPGNSNWQIAQATALLEAGIVLDFLPDAAQWRQKGAEVLNACFVRQFRPDGSHLENTTGYQSWMTEEMIAAYLVGRLRPDLQLQTNLDIIANALQFNHLSRRFAFNDSSYGREFPAWKPLPDLRRHARRLQIDWTPWERHVFPDAGLVFGGNEREIFCFDAGRYGGWHSHLSRLSIVFGADGYHLLIDPAITTYERSKNTYECGRTTWSHPTVNFNGAHQIRQDATLLDAQLNPRYSVMVGEFNGGSFQGPFSDRYEKNLDADFRRMVLWLDRDYLLIFDRTRIVRTPDGKTVTNYVFPAAPMEKWQLDPEHLAWYSLNAKRPNLYLKMLLKPAEKVNITCVEGQETPTYAGWTGTVAEKLVPAPLVTFSADTGNDVANAVTLAAAFPAGASVPAATVTTAAPGQLDFSCKGVADILRYSPDFTTVTRLRAGKVESEAVLLLVRDGKRAFCYRARNLHVDGRALPLPNADYTGWIDLP